MSPIKQSISWWCFVPAKLTPQALVKAAAEIGYAAIELVEPEDYQDDQGSWAGDCFYTRS